MTLQTRSARLLICLTYYRPHVSGLTLYNQRLAEGLAARGREVTVLTSQYRKDLAPEETVHGVRIVRVPIWGRLGKGVLPRNLLWRAARYLTANDVVLLSLPNTPIEALIVPMLGRLLGRKVVSILHCHIRLPPGVFNRFAEWAVRIACRWALLWSHRVVAYTDDYAESVAPLRSVRRKRSTIPPPVVCQAPSREAVRRFRSDHKLDEGVVLGFAGRIATEKGVEDLLAAFEILRSEHPAIRILLAGEWENVLGEKKCRDRLEPLIRRHADRVRLLGVLDPEEMAVFYAACDILILPSRNRTESFGLVQVESMLCGTPVIASGLPGVRVPVRLTGMGLVVPPEDPQSIAAAVREILEDRSRFILPRSEIERLFSIETTLDSYEILLTELMEDREQSS